MCFQMERDLGTEDNGEKDEDAGQVDEEMEVSEEWGSKKMSFLTNEVTPPLLCLQFTDGKVILNHCKGVIY